MHEISGTLLHLLSRNSPSEMLLWALEHGADPNDGGRSCRSPALPCAGEVQGVPGGCLTASWKVAVPVATDQVDLAATVPGRADG